MFSTVMPKWLISTPAGTDAPNPRHADECAAVADVPLPALPDAQFDRNPPRHVGRQNRSAIRLPAAPRIVSNTAG